MPEYKLLSDSDNATIIEAIQSLLSSQGAKRIDFGLTRNMEGSVYWAGTVIRLDIKGYNE